MNFESLSRQKQTNKQKTHTIAIRFSLPQVCQPVPPSVFTMLFIPLSNNLTGYFNVVPNWW